MSREVTAAASTQLKEHESTSTSSAFNTSAVLLVRQTEDAVVYTAGPAQLSSCSLNTFHPSERPRNIKQTNMRHHRLSEAEHKIHFSPSVTNSFKPGTSGANQSSAGAVAPVAPP